MNLYIKCDTHRYNGNKFIHGNVDGSCQLFHFTLLSVGTVERMFMYLCKFLVHACVFVYIIYTRKSELLIVSICLFVYPFRHLYRIQIYSYSSHTCTDNDDLESNAFSLT